MFTRIIALSLLLLPSVSFAWEKDRNPDRFPSIGLTLDGTSSEGDVRTANGLAQDVESKTSEFLIDTRLPLSQSFTLSVGLGGLSSNSKGKDSPTLFANETDMSGGRFFVSGRYYFNH